MTQAKRKAELRESLQTVRERTLWLFDQVPEEFLKKRVHNFYSPIGWHFGHIARTEEYWVLTELHKRAPRDAQLSFLLADTADNPKDNRVNLPDRTEIWEYMANIRRDVLDTLDQAEFSTQDPFLNDGYAWDFALQHECQHQETIAEMLTLIHQRLDDTCKLGEQMPFVRGVQDPKIEIPAGSFCMGSDDHCGYDNEKCSHQVEVKAFKVDKYPITAFQWREFMEDRGYFREELWSKEGWKWRQEENVETPEYWMMHGNLPWAFCPVGIRPVHPDEPVNCISWYEAEAYCDWAGRRMLTEEEREYIATCDPGKGQSRCYPWGDAAPSEEKACNGLRSWHPLPVGLCPVGDSAFGVSDLAGGVWEWTSTPFLPYPGFQAFPYDGYSKDHMLGVHKVCRGGSWATADPILRRSFRNWYVPSYRQGFLGLRCADR